jgi:hypothetical protein
MPHFCYNYNVNIGDILLVLGTVVIVVFMLEKWKLLEATSQTANPFRLNFVVVRDCMICLFLFAVITALFLIFVVLDYEKTATEKNTSLIADIVIPLLLPIILGGGAGYLASWIQYCHIPLFVSVGRLSLRVKKIQGLLLGSIFASASVAYFIRIFEKENMSLTTVSRIAIIMALSLVSGTIASCFSFSGIIAVARFWMSKKIPEPLDLLIRTSNLSALHTFLYNGMFADANYLTMNKRPAAAEMENPQTIGYRYLELSVTHRMEGKRIFNEISNDRSNDAFMKSDVNLHHKYVDVLYRMSMEYIDGAMHEFRKRPLQKNLWATESTGRFPIW